MARKHEAVTKIARPLVNGAFSRKRLFKVLDKGRSRSVLWISSPGGSRKTTLVASILTRENSPASGIGSMSWTRISPLFFYYIGLAAKRASPRFKKPLSLLTPEYLMGIDAFTQRYFDQLFARLKPPFILVFDNDQNVSPDSGFHQVVGHGFSQVPEGVNVILMSRRVPPRFSRVSVRTTGCISSGGMKYGSPPRNYVRGGEKCRLRADEGIGRKIATMSFTKNLRRKK